MWGGAGHVGDQGDQAHLFSQANNMTTGECSNEPPHRAGAYMNSDDMPSNRYEDAVRIWGF